MYADMKYKCFYSNFIMTNHASIFSKEKNIKGNENYPFASKTIMSAANIMFQHELSTTSVRNDNTWKYLSVKMKVFLIGKFLHL